MKQFLAFMLIVVMFSTPLTVLKRDNGRQGFGLMWTFVKAASVESDLGTNLVSCWDLDETSGSRADAITASGNDLTDGNTVGSNTGLVDTAADFNRGTSEYLSITDASQTGLDLGSVWTISAWMYMDSLPSLNTGYTLYSKWDDGTDNGYWFFYRNEGGTLRFNTFLDSDGTGGASDDWKVNQTLSTGTWYLVTLTKNGSAGELWLDTSSIGTNTFSFSGAQPDVGSPFVLGTRNAPSEDTDFDYDGRLDVVAVIDGTAWGSTEVSTMYNSGAGIACTGAAGNDGINTQVIIVGYKHQDIVSVADIV